MMYVDDSKNDFSSLHCVAQQWVKAAHLASCTKNHEKGPDLIPGADTVNHAVNRFGVGKLEAICKHWVTTADDCEM